MPTVQANEITINYDQQGTGEPLILIPYLAADYACYAFQVAEYAKHFTCLSVDLRGAGETDKPEGSYTTELFAEDVAAFMQALGIPQAHVAGLSLGAATGMWLAAKYPDKVKSLSLHSAWPKTDPFLKAAVESWQVMAQGLLSVPEMVIRGIFLWCFTPELYFDEIPLVTRIVFDQREKLHECLIPCSFVMDYQCGHHHKTCPPYKLLFPLTPFFGLLMA